MSIERVVIVGGGLAGAKTAEALRDQGFGGDVVLLAAERHLPYDRPPLSKDYLAGSQSFEDGFIEPEDWYGEQRIDLRLGVHATEIDREAHQVRLDDGSTVGYDKLVLATGSTPRTLSLPGADATGVHVLRTREDADAIKAEFGEGRRLAVIGGGWIGLEIAATARNAGTDVTVLESSELPLLAVLGPEIARVFADMHREHGVDLRTEVKVEEITTKNGHASGVRLADGTTVEADSVVIGVGAAPALSLAEAAGLDIDNGVLVDASLRTSDPDVYAVGDIAHHDHPVLGHRIRVEHWNTAATQPASAVAALLGGDARYEELPYFFSDQYDLGMEYVGHAPGGSYAKVVVRGDLATREFVAHWVGEDGRVLAVMNVNIWDVPEQVRELIASGRAVDADKLTDPEVDYASL